ncbi:MAG: hypothetical protein ABS76_12345 [Pelagibacterium sp. SCN 64-44]|nr:MAG: hypothetical protein ABS76_12345 [Pelagibacterium sp. SCN 64-44]
MTDIARLAHVSVGTVSNVVNGTIAVKKERRERVLKAIEQLGYSPNVLAQSLRRRQNTVIGICVPHVANTYFMQIVDVFEKLSTADRREIIHVYARREEDHLKEKVDWLIKFKISGLIMLPSIDDAATLESIARSGVPAVIVDRPVDDARFDQVITDATGSMREIIRGLAVRGHRSVLFLTASRSFLVTRYRIEGLNDAVASIPGMMANIVEIPVGEEDFVRQLAAEFVSSNPPTAVIVGSGQIAARTFRALRRLGNLIPHWPALVSFDQPEWADLATPAVSVVRHPVEAIAAKAWQLLVDRMQGYDGPPRQILLSGAVDLSAAQFINAGAPVSPLSPGEDAAPGGLSG